MTALPYSKENLVRLDKGFGRHDIFGYKNFGQELQELVSKISEEGEGQRIAINGDWGCGKTIFLKMWQEHIEKQEFTVIYYDAFKNDYQDNIFSTLSKAIYYKLGDANKSKFKEIIQKNIHHFTKNIAEKIDGGIISGKIIDEMFKQWDDEKNDPYDNFTKSLKELIRNQCEGEPLIFIVDELDRCRPDFALELLEKIKHAFNLPNLHFVFALNIDALARLVKKTYGLDKRYLDKFFKCIIPLPRSEKKDGFASNHFKESVESYIPYFFSGFVTSNITANSTALAYIETYRKIAQYKTKDNKFFSIRDFQRMHDYFIVNLNKTTEREGPGEQVKYYSLIQLYLTRIERPEYFEDFHNFIYKTNQKQANHLIDCFSYLKKERIILINRDGINEPEDWQESSYYKNLLDIIHNID